LLVAPWKADTRRVPAGRWLCAAHGQSFCDVDRRKARISPRKGNFLGPGLACASRTYNSKGGVRIFRSRPGNSPNKHRVRANGGRLLTKTQGEKKKLEEGNKLQEVSPPYGNCILNRQKCHRGAGDGGVPTPLGGSRTDSISGTDSKKTRRQRKDKKDYLLDCSCNAQKKRFSRPRKRNSVGAGFQPALRRRARKKESADRS